MICGRLILAGTKSDSSDLKASQVSEESGTAVNELVNALSR